MAQQRQQRRRWIGGGGGVLRLGAVLILALALLSLFLARADAASLAGVTPASFSGLGVATALENALAQEVMASGRHSKPSTAAAEEGGDGDVVLERVAMESTQDYDGPGPNNRHMPHHP